MNRKLRKNTFYFHRPMFKYVGILTPLLNCSNHPKRLYIDGLALVLSFLRSVSLSLARFRSLIIHVCMYVFSHFSQLRFEVCLFILMHDNDVDYPSLSVASRF